MELNIVSVGNDCVSRSPLRGGYRGALRQRDGALKTRAPKSVLQDRSLEILAEVRLNLDASIAKALK